MQSPSETESFFTLDNSLALTGTGSDSETTFSTITIPAGALGSNGWVKIKAWFSCTNSVNDKTAKIELGSDLFAAKVVTEVDGFFIEAIIRNLTPATQNGIDQDNVLGTGTSDTTANVDLLITGQLEDTSETLTLLGVIAERAYG